MADGTLDTTRMSWVSHAEGRESHPAEAPGAGERRPGVIRRVIAAVRGYLPNGDLLDDATFHRRHLLLCWILGLHIPALFAFGIWQGVGVLHAAADVVAPTILLICAWFARSRRVGAFFLTFGLVFCSYILVHLSEGSIEAHFHFFVLIGLIALYQDWVPFIWNAVFTVVSHGVGGTVSPDTMYNHYAAQNRPWLWAGIHGAAVLAACAGVVVFWKNTEIEQRRSSALSAELATAELAAAQAETARRQAMSQLLVNLARRNQSLLDRQLRLIADLEQREVEPDALANLFQLDHVATRIRRNAESLLVLSGDEPPRRWGQPVPLAEVVRAGAAEVEDYQRVEVLVHDHLEVTGRAVADLAHLLAELIENATMFSPPSSEVRVRSYLASAEPPTYALSVEDTGIGMTEVDRQAANRILAAGDDTGLLGSRLGLHVVNRLARRYGLQVQLAETPGGGVTALVMLPGNLLFVSNAYAGYSEPVPAGAAQSGAFPSPPPPAGLPPAGLPPASVAMASTATDPRFWTVAGAEVLTGSSGVGGWPMDAQTEAALRVTGRSIAPPAPPHLPPVRPADPQALPPPGPVPPPTPAAPAARTGPTTAPPAPSVVPADRTTGGTPVVPAHRTTRETPAVPADRTTGGTPVLPADRTTGGTPVVPAHRTTGETPVVPADRTTGGTPVVPAHRTTGETPVVPAHRTTGETPVVPADRTTGETPVVPADRTTGETPAVPEGTAPPAAPGARTTGPTPAVPAELLGLREPARPAESPERVEPSPAHLAASGAPPVEQDESAADPTASGLARRVPGEALAAVRDQSLPSATDAPGANGPEPNGADAVTSDTTGSHRRLEIDEDETRARARVSAMLSRFQASQRAGRAKSEAQAAADEAQAAAEAAADEDQP